MSSHALLDEVVKRVQINVRRQLACQCADRDPFPGVLIKSVNDKPPRFQQSLVFDCTADFSFQISWSML